MPSWEATNSETITPMIASVTEKLIHVLPPAFVVLLILNVVFIGMAVYLMTHNTDQRAILLTKIVDACLLDRKSDPP